MRLLLCLSSAFAITWAIAESTISSNNRSSNGDALDPPTVADPVVTNTSVEQSQLEPGASPVDGSRNDDLIREERVLIFELSEELSPMIAGVWPFNHPAASFENIGNEDGTYWLTDKSRLKDWLLQVDEYRGQGYVFTDQEMFNLLRGKRHDHELFRALLWLWRDPAMKLVLTH
uniref:Uncharacterized protein n=1 Tax=Peronospora matthiolae TaxID=2874970 RepID=A0AAV1URC0_9STRA